MKPKSGYRFSVYDFLILCASSRYGSKSREEVQLTIQRSFYDYWFWPSVKLDHFTRNFPYLWRINNKTIPRYNYNSSDNDDDNVNDIDDWQLQWQLMRTLTITVTMKNDSTTNMFILSFLLLHVAEKYFYIRMWNLVDSYCDLMCRTV